MSWFARTILQISSSDMNEFRRHTPAGRSISWLGYRCSASCSDLVYRNRASPLFAPVLLEAWTGALLSSVIPEPYLYFRCRVLLSYASAVGAWY